jgi:hypothetical protein
MFLLLLLGCKKKNEDIISLKGSVYDPNLNVYVGGARVTLYSSKIQSGIYSSAYKSIVSKVTDANGKFEMEFKKEQVIDYKINITRDNYFSYENKVNPENWLGGNVYKPVYEIYPEAYVRINIENYFPSDENDRVIYGFDSGYYVCPECCTHTYITGYGMDYKSSLKCITQGNKYAKISWHYTKNKNELMHDTSLLCKAFDTTFVNIRY